jgi:1-acyl-sn-glycerol-3-phosphate acyltransferase
MKPWTYDISPTVGMTLTESLAHTPREDMVFAAVHIAWSALLWLAVRLYFRLRVTGRENLPREGSFALVANHSSHADEVTLQSVLPLRHIDRVFPVVAEDYFFRTPMRSLFSAALLNAVPLQRSVGAKGGLEACHRLLDSGRDVLIVFPEGTRSTTGEMGRFKLGIGWLLANTSYTVVPAHIEGTHEAWPKGSKFPKPKKVTIHLGKPMSFSAVNADREGYLAVASKLEAAVRDLADHTGGVT